MKITRIKEKNSLHTFKDSTNIFQEKRKELFTTIPTIEL